MGEAVSVDYEIENDSNHIVTNGSLAFAAATGNNQPYSFAVTLDEASFPEGTYTVNVTAIDASGNAAPVRSVNFVIDITPPLITLNGSNSIQIEFGSAYMDSGATAMDVVDGDITGQITVSGAVYTNQVGTHTLTYQVSDAAGNPAIKTRTVNVVDSVSPVITLLGSNPIEVEVGSTFTDPGATAMDAVDGDVTGQITVSGAVYTNQVGTYTLTYQVSDAAGNAAVDMVRTVEVIHTQNPPSSGQPSDTLSSNAELAKLNVNTSDKLLVISPEFMPKITEYTAETDANQIELEVDPAHPDAVVKLAGERIEGTTTVPLLMGVNQLEIMVRAEDGSSKTYTLTINRIEHSTSSAPECPFTDIENHWAEAEICEAEGLGIVVGVDADTFVPNGYVTRTEFAVMLMRTLQVDISGESSVLLFSDNDSIPQWARPAIQTAVAEGILKGYLDGTLRPQHTVTWAEMAAMVSKAMGWEASGTESPYFSDDDSIPVWAKAYVENARKHGILVGRVGDRFVPDGLTTRAEAAVVLLRLWKTLI